MIEFRDSDYYNYPRYQDTLTADQFSLVVSSGPHWERLATRFRTPYNHDLVHLKEGPAGCFYTSNDGGNWWFRASYLPLKITWNKTIGYRLNQADPEIKRNGLAPIARMITKTFDSVEWPAVDGSHLREVVFAAREIEERILAPLEAYDAGYTIYSTPNTFWSVNDLPDDLTLTVESFPINGDDGRWVFYTGEAHPRGLYFWNGASWGRRDRDTFPYVSAPFWLSKPIAPSPPPPAPVQSDYEYTFDRVTVSESTTGEPPVTTQTVAVTPVTETMGLYSHDLADWTFAQNEYLAAYAQYVTDLEAWNAWRATPVFCLMNGKRVTHLLSATYRDGLFLFVGLAPFYTSKGEFMGWGAAKESRVKLTHRVSFGPSLPASNTANGFFFHDTPDGKVLYQWDDGWTVMPSGNTFPENPAHGDVFYLHINSERADEGVYLFNDNEWVLNYTPARVTTYGQWLPDGTGIMSSLEQWNTLDIGAWVPVPEAFDFTRDPREQFPYA